MRKAVRIIALLFVGAFIVIQFFQPPENNGKITASHIFMHETIPDTVKVILRNSCLDCHSSHTNYLWYHKIAPVSWFINKHIVDGKKKLNLSEWGTKSAVDKISDLGDIYEETERKKMPLKEYTMLHKEARLTDGQIKLLCNWAEQTGAKIMGGFSE